METSHTRRQAGALIHTARRKIKLSQRALAKQVGISETWLRAMTAGLRADDPQRAADGTWLALARAVNLDPGQVFAVLGRDLPEGSELTDADEGDRLADPDGHFVMERTTHRGRILEIVTDLEADTDDLPDEVADEIIRKSVDTMAAQARLTAEMERRRWERAQRKRAAEDQT